jgi:nitrile hydratase subunit beta
MLTRSRKPRVFERLEVGQRVRARAEDPPGHCRLPRYVRGHLGTIVADFGTSVVPDRVVAGDPGNPEPLYAVRFDAHELWGSSGHTVTIELWQSYLEPR